MIARPISVTVIAVIQLVLGVSSILFGIMSFIPPSPAAATRRAEREAEVQSKSPLPIPIQHANSIATAAIALVCGYYLLLGKNWARIVYLIWGSLHHLFFLYVGGTSPRIVQLPGILIFVAFVVLLYSPQANTFFATGGAGLTAQSRPSLRRIASFVFYVVSGIFFLGASMMAFSVMQFGLVKSLVAYYRRHVIGRWKSVLCSWRPPELEH
jgi:hypothetical protein